MAIGADEPEAAELDEEVVVKEGPVEGWPLGLSSIMSEPRWV